MTLKGMGYLRKKLANYKMGVDTRYNQYAMQHNDIDVGITIPPQIRQQYRAVLGWTAKGVDSLADRLVFREFANDEFGAVKWLVGETIVNFTQSIVDDTIQRNVVFQYKAGLSPKITRRTAGKCCKWCQELEGSYKYPSVPHDIYRRHSNCRCTVEYYPQDGRRQNVHTRKWSNINQEDVERRKQIGIESAEERKRKRDERIAKFGNPRRRLS